MRLRNLLICLAVTLLAGTAVADVIHLKNGRQIEGVVVSENDTEVQVKTRYGVVPVKKSQIDRIEEKKTPTQICRERRKALAPDDADGHYELALYCKEHKLRKQEKELYAATLEIEPQHDGANEAVGNVQYEGTWMSPEEKARREKDANAADMREKGFVLYEGRWVTPEDKANLEKGLVKHEGKWMTPDEVKIAQGFVKFKGDWVPREELDRIRIKALYKELIQADLEVAVTKHFAAIGTYTEDELLDIAETAEQVYTDLALVFGIDPDSPIFSGSEVDLGRTRCHIVYSKRAFEYSRLVDAMMKRYPEDLNERRARLMKTQKGFYFIYPSCYVVGYQMPNTFQQVKGAVAHKVGHVILQRYRYRGNFSPWWLIEGLGTWAEINCFGHCDTYCITEKGYAAAGGDAPAQKWGGLSQWREIVKEQVAGMADRTLLELSSASLNELNFKDLSKCWSLCEWWIATDREGFVKLVNLLKAKVPFESAVKEAFGKSSGQIDNEWRGYVRGNY